MIVSASYRTDIPAFYGTWFANRLAAGFCRVVNPYGGPPGVVRLDPEAAQGFVFWTRNAGPFLPVLDGLAAAGRPFVVQFTITGYPRALERGVIDPAAAVAQACEIARRYGPRTLVWRYDPIVLGSLTDAAFHRRTFATLADRLAGACDEVTVSVVHPYRKTRRNLENATRRHGFTWEDGPLEHRRDLVGELATAAAERGLKLTVCAQPALAAAGGAAARCIDADRLAAIAGRPLAARRKGNRPGCECAESRDIGAYDTCPQGCAYCYAVDSRTRAQARRRTHDPHEEYLLAPARGA